MRWTWRGLTDERLQCGRRSVAPPRNDGESNPQLPPRHAPIRLEIAPARRLHHARWQRRGRRVTVPAAGAAFRVEIVAQRLLVETRLWPARDVVADRPEARGIRRHHLVDQDHAAIRILAELELGVGNDDALLAGELLAERVD